MKKMYLKPEIELVEVETAQMLAASVLGFGDDAMSGDNALAGDYDDDFEDESLW